MKQIEISIKKRVFFVFFFKPGRCSWPLSNFIYLFISVMKNKQTHLYVVVAASADFVVVVVFNSFTRIGKDQFTFNINTIKIEDFFVV